MLRKYAFYSGLRGVLRDKIAENYPDKARVKIPVF